MRILVVIPARGGSKSIPRKNLLLLGNKPLVSFAIENSFHLKRHVEKQNNDLVDIVVSSDDEEILEIAQLLGSLAIRRPDDIAQDMITLDPVILHAVYTMEQEREVPYDMVITVQPTSPLLRAETLIDAVKLFRQEEVDTVISVSEERHLYWKRISEIPQPLYKERKNRQCLEPLYRETGSFVITNRAVLTRGRRFGERIELYPLSFPESIDVDSWHDLAVAESCLMRKKIAIRCEGDRDIGLGHVYRMLTLAKHLWAHDIRFFSDHSKRLGIEKIRRENMPISEFETDEELFQLLESFEPNIVINDFLDTSADYVQKLKTLGCRVVNFEDLGTGSKYADIVINALYEWSGSHPNHYFGYRYECLRQDCYYILPKEQVSPNVNTILVAFGGTDPNNTTLKVLQGLESLGLREKEIKVVQGIGYSYTSVLKSYISNLISRGFDVELHEDVRLMAPLLREAELVICSNGRMVYEAAAMAVPTVTISQNTREVTHLFSGVCPGILNLGLASELRENDIAAALFSVIEDFDQRRHMHQELLPFAWEIRKGIDRVVRLILKSGV